MRRWRKKRRRVRRCDHCHRCAAQAFFCDVDRNCAILGAFCRGCEPIGLRAFELWLTGWTWRSALRRAVRELLVEGLIRQATGT